MPAARPRAAPARRRRPSLARHPHRRGPARRAPHARGRDWTATPSPAPRSRCAARPTATAAPIRNGFDCSGFTQYVFSQYGLSLPREVREQYRVGKSVKAGGSRAGRHPVLHDDRAGTVARGDRSECESSISCQSFKRSFTTSKRLNRPRTIRLTWDRHSTFDLPWLPMISTCATSTAGPIGSMRQRHRFPPPLGLLQRARELAVEGANDSLDPQQRSSIATEVQQLLEQAVVQGNSTLARGSSRVSRRVRIHSRKGTGVTYSGDSGQMVREIDPGTTIRSTPVDHRPSIPSSPVS